MAKSFGLRHYRKSPRHIVKAKDLPSLQLGDYREIYPAIRAPLRQHPLHHHQLRRRMPSGRLDSSFIATLNRGRAYGRHGIVFTARDELLKEAEGIVSPAEEHPLRWKDLRAPELFPGKLAVLAAEGYRNYYHLLFDIVAKYQMLQRSGLKYDKIYLREPTRAFQKEILGLIGIREDECYYGTKSEHLEAEQIHYPSLPAKPFTVAPWVYSFLREKILGKVAINPKRRRKLYISRSQAKFRRVLNEDELIPRLKARGFTVLHAENLSVVEQAKLFAEAELVLGAHGAGLSNLVFSSPGTRVIEIFSEGHPEPCFWFLSQYGKLEHHCLQPSASSLTTVQRQQCGIYLPWEILVKSL